MPQKQIDPFLPIFQTAYSNWKQLDELEKSHWKIYFVGLLNVQIKNCKIGAYVVGDYKRL